MNDRALYRAARFRFPWFEVSVGLTALLAFVVLLGGWVVWLLNHRMGPFPLWLQVVTSVCPTVSTVCGLMLRFDERDHRSQGGRTTMRST